MIATWSPLTLYLWAMLLAGIGGAVKYLHDTKGRKHISVACYRFILHALGGGCVAGFGHETLLAGRPASVIYSGVAYALGINAAHIVRNLAGGSNS